MAGGISRAKEGAMIGQRKLGRTGIMVSALGFGCGAVGGLMVRGSEANQTKAVARAIERGITYFDTAADYGDGQSERNLGRVLAELKPTVTVGTKFRLRDGDYGRIGEAIATALEDSLRRLGLDAVDLYQLHNPITVAGGAPDLTARQVLDEVVPALERLRRQGKLRFIGITAIGDAAALREVVTSGAIDTAQVPYNLLNPSGVAALPAGFPAHDFDRLMQHALGAGVGVIGIRVLAGGALSGAMERHPIGAPSVAPIASGASYADDVARARMFTKLIDRGYVATLPEAALRFAISTETMATTLIGMSTLAQFEAAADAVAKGPLPVEALAMVADIQRGMGGGH
jgi:L-galactose dehydrogenase/L-glyceraldehyde 3-phosphate reductase